VNIGKILSNYPGTIPLFTWIWLIGSVTAASYFAFWVFPGIVDPVAEIYFQTKVGNATIYYPNSQTYRTQHLSALSDTNHLYYTGCNLVALSQVQNCDPSYNWENLDPKDVDCTDVSNCHKERYFIPKDVQAQIFRDSLKSINGLPIPAKDPNTVSFSDPAGWGDAGKWPVFFVTLFLAVKLRRAAGEFAFTGYTKG
jgi:hypothetical protein